MAEKMINVNSSVRSSGGKLKLRKMVSGIDFRFNPDENIQIIKYLTVLQ
ncbi:hypothetical protein CI610_02264 [invertebrate metagenome]|uniref:Uncharacterized protein n=1 Tax=invertebrate metagenome TaxID=1711999 RepID=A0A2H9T6E5_9ZZZZ